MNNQRINVIINGANGRMGKEAQSAIANDSDLNLVACLSRQDDLSAAIKKYNSLSDSSKSPLVVVDLTSAECVFNNTKIIIENNSCPVIGSSGLLEQDIQSLQALANKHNVNGTIVPNFSLGAVLMMHFAHLAAKYYDQAEIIERHHPDKLDSPSGTAIRTADLIAQNLRTKVKNLTPKETIPHARGASYKNIPIHSLRISGSCGHQSILFGGKDESLTITHDSIHRASFMPGVILACKKAHTLKGLCVGLEHLLTL